MKTSPSIFYTVYIQSKWDFVVRKPVRRRFAISTADMNAQIGQFRKTINLNVVDGGSKFVLGQFNQFQVMGVRTYRRFE